MTRVAIVLNLAIVALGVIGIASPYTMLQVSRPLESLYGAAAFRVIFGGTLVVAAHTSRAPRALRVLGFGYLAAGFMTPFLGVEFGLGVHDWWVAQGPVFIRIWAVIAFAFGSGLIFLLWPSSVPVRRRAGSAALGRSRVNASRFLVELACDPRCGVKADFRWRTPMEAVKDPRSLFEVERQTEHAVRPGFRIAELQISPTQKVPWHYHSHIQDTFYVLEGHLRLFLRDPKEEVRLGPGDTYAVRPRRPHLVTNGGDTSATFLVLQGIGEYDFVPLT